MPLSRCLLCLFLLLQLHASEGKLELGTAKLSSAVGGSRWQYLGKFGYGIGEGSYDLRIRSRVPASMFSVNLEVFLDEEWDQLGAVPACRRALTGPARRTHVLTADDEWGPWVGGLLEQKVRPHIWYFALSKCHGQSNATYDIDFELRYLQPDSSELSIELRHMPTAVLLAVLCLSMFLVRFVQRCRRFRQNAGEVHPVIQTLAIAVLLQWMAQVLHLIHLQFYEQGGIGESAIDVAADTLCMLSQVVSSTLLIVIAQGYTLLGSKDVELGTVKQIAAVVAVLHVMLVGHGKLQGDHSGKHHENEGLIGWAILVVRLVLYIWFVERIRALRQNATLRLEDFLQHFQFAGSLYFLSYLVIYIVGQAFAPYLQHPIMQIGQVVMQTVSAFWLSDLFLTRGVYFQVSTLSSPLLPGGFGNAHAGSKHD